MKTETLELVEHSNLLLSPPTIFSAPLPDKLHISKVSENDCWAPGEMSPAVVVRFMTASDL